MSRLPVELTSFIGRDRELIEIRRLLASTPAVTLTGPGGIGKSRLAVRAARRLDRHFPDGTWLVELADLDEPELVGDAVARSLGAQERQGQPITETLLTHLQDRRALVILDNCEHVLDACRALVVAILSACPRMRVVCTSRERLDVPGEAVIPVSGLAFPTGDNEPAGDRWHEIEALRLLVERTVALAPEFVLNADNIAAAVEICRHLDGLPLAIELAAVRLASMSMEDLRDRLDDRLSLLTARTATGAERGQTLRATMDWSYELLSDEERTLWRRLSVFAGSFGLRAAEDICAGHGLERERIVDLMAGLVAKSILTLGHGGSRGRYRLLETLRVYGAERLAEADEDAAMAAAHAHWYARRFSGGDRPWWSGRAQAATLVDLDVEWANVETALDFFARDPSGSTTGLRMATDLLLYWLVRGRFRAGCRRLEHLLAADTAPRPERVMALRALGFLLQATGDYTSPLPLFEEASTLGERAGNAREMGYVLHGLGLLHLRRGEIDRARGFATRGCELMREADDPAGYALLCCFRTTCILSDGDWEEAHRMATEALIASEHAEESFARGIAYGLLGMALWLQGDSAAAEENLREAVDIQSRIGHRWGLLTTLETLAWVVNTAGQPERAAMLLGATAAMSREFGVPLFPYGPAQEHHDACERVLRRDLGEARYLDCRRRGQSLDPQGVLALAAARSASSDGSGEVVPDITEPSVLSTREWEVARLVARGLSNPAIAAELFVSGATVKTHVSHILSKLGLGSRTQLGTWLAEHDTASATGAAALSEP